MKRLFTLDYSQTFPSPAGEAHVQGDPARRHEALREQLVGLGLVPLLEARRQLRRRLRAVHERRRGPEHLRRVRLLRLLHGREEPEPDHERRPALERPAAPVQALGLLRVRRSGSRSGRSAYYRTGTPLTRYGYSDAYGRYEFFLTRAATRAGRLRTTRSDLHLGYPIAVGPVKVNLLVDVFNLLNTQRPSCSTSATASRRRTTSKRRP